jgi:2-polyprenyl-6-methoxyphenol hydroxylase-like FAD-dependent oxidoreductase
VSVVRFNRAAVLGCGLAGIAAAAALRESCGEVVLIERDRLPADPASRRGLPQSDQLHNLLGRAQIELERLLPGFGTALRKAGCGEARVADQTHVFESGRHAPERDLGLRILCAWRPVIDHVALRLLLAGGSVNIRDGLRAVGLEVTIGGAVSGAVVKADDGRTETIDAEIVVDATGAGSRARQWLANIGQHRPPVDTAHPDQWYVTCLCDRPDSWIGDEAFWLIFPSPPHTRAGLVSPVTPSQWYVSLSGCSNDKPPRNFEAMQAFARTLEDRSIAELLKHSTARGVPHLFRRRIATWQRYDRLPNPLVGFLPIGDAIAALNPLFGQGISVAAWQASGLADLLKDASAGSDRGQLASLTAAYLRHAAMVCGKSWTLREVVDRAVRRGRGSADRSRTLSELIRQDPALHSHYVRIWHLLEPAESLEEILDSLASRNLGTTHSI